MKILELRFKNLNSLYGEWVINLTYPEYISNGIFALTGPTGAGKSTILDAICLALYGATPRLGKITKSRNAIMSCQTGECYAEILFESQAGRFRCHWEQRRARKEPEGKLQEQEHEIADADTGKPIETKKSLVGDVIEEKTGMDFERFTRSILLAQGAFDTFLKADIEQKSKILEQISGTEIYSEISRRVHERHRDELNKLNLLHAEISGIVILEEEQEEEIHQDLKTKQKHETELASKSTATEKGITWLSTIEELKKEIRNLTDEAVKLQDDIKAFKPERNKLEQAIKAASLDGAYATLITLREQQADNQTELKTEEGTLPELKTTTNTQAEELKATAQLTLKSKDALKDKAPLIQRIRSLDQKIAEQSKVISAGAQTLNKEAAKIKTSKQARENEQKKRIEGEKSLKTIEQYLKEHAQDEWLISGLAGIEEQFENLRRSQQEISHKETNLKNANAAMEEASKSLERATKECKVRKQELEDTSQSLQQEKDALNELLDSKLLREYRTKKETLLHEMAYIKKIDELEDQRAKLEDGKPCPLCGSTKHPFAEGNISVPDEIELEIESLSKLISKAEDKEAAIRRLEQRKSDAIKNLNESEKIQTNCAHDKKTVEKALLELKDELSRLRTDFEKLKLAILGKLERLDITEISETQVPLLQESLKSRFKAWQEKIKQKNEIEKQMTAIDSEIKSLDAVIETQDKALSEKHNNQEQLKRENEARIDERKKLYGNKKPDDEEERLYKAIEDSEEAENKAKSLNTKLQQALTAAKTRVESLKKLREQREPELKKAETVFSEALTPAGFANERQFHEARMTNEDRETLTYRAKALDSAQTELNAKQKDRERRLATEHAKKVSDKTLEELKWEFEEYEESLKELRDAISALKHKLKENLAAKERIKKKHSSIEAQKKECDRWTKLHNLIGSSDGKKYRNFAQSLTFELLVSHANQQLSKMTDRYLLIRDALDLNVVDNYQAAEIRSTKNLSGGESFIVSLALALGLSKMSSQKVRVDSLFLDEGFSTLDEEALETALEALSGLQQDGKLIGIISHVSELKERISTQINITPLSGGRSSLSGAGCTKVLKSK